MLQFFLAMLETPEEKKQFADLYEEHRSRMFSVAFGHLHDDYLAEDAVNQAFLKLIKHFQRLEGYSCEQIKSFLAIIARNTAIDMYNHRHRVIEVPLEEVYDTEIKHVDHFVVQLNYSEIYEAVERLPDIYSEMLYLFYYLGLSVNEIASSLNLSNSAVKQRLMRARLKLRAMLEGIHHDETRLYSRQPTYPSGDW